MRLLLCIDTFGLIGGSERYGLAAAEGLRARGHDVEVLCGALGEGAPDLPVHVEPAWSEPRAGPAELERLDARVRSIRADAALVLSARSARAFELLVEQSPRLPLLRCVQDHTPFCPGLDKMHADGAPCESPMGLACLQRHVLGAGCVGFRREHHRAAPLLGAVGGLWKHMRGFALAQRADRLAVFSSYMQGELRRAGVPASKIALLRYFTRSGGAAAGAELPAATAAFLGSGAAPLVLTPARLALPDKGIDHLLTALGKLRAPFRAIVAGSGPAQAWLMAKARAEGLGERVHFSGWLAAEPLERLYASADLVVVPSVWNEPFGLVGLEAMAHGKPVVAYSAGGIPEWLDHGTTGLLAPRGDTDTLARAIDRLLEDPGARRAMGRAGRERLERDFSPEPQLDRLEALLAELARSR